MSNEPTNPYVGPQPFTAQDRSVFFGRDRDTMALARTLTVERIVLLHSPSGAGKTSLIQAALVPEMERRGFGVLPIIRVHHPELEGSVNYTLSTLMHLETGKPPEDQLSEHELRELDIDTYLNKRWPESEGNERIVLVFDQFEEILTLDHMDLEAKRTFFNDLGAALGDRRLWALFAMREEFVAGLHPFVSAVPTHLSSTFQLALLDERNAADAITSPARVMGKSFEDDAAKLLVDNLRSVHVKRPDQVSYVEKRPTVEPLHLQVACFQLWEKWERLGLDAITREHVAEFADVDRALEGYYDDRVHHASIASGISERFLRSWIEDHLFDRTGIRHQVRKGAEVLGQINERAVTALKDSYLIREESARESNWYELAHDRLVKPIEDANRAWRSANLEYFQRQAARWQRSERPQGLLLRSDELIEAQRWQAEHAGELTPTEEEFLGQCQQAEDQRQQTEALKTLKEKEALAREREKAARAREEAAVLKSRRAGLLYLLGSSLAIAAVLAFVYIQTLTTTSVLERQALTAPNLYDYGRLLALSGETERARTVFEQVQLVDPNVVRSPDAELSLVIGNNLIEAGDLEAGVTELTNATQSDPALGVTIIANLLDLADRLAFEKEDNARSAYEHLVGLSIDSLPFGHSMFETICQLGAQYEYGQVGEPACMRFQLRR